jgi:hypothetical protein
MFAAAKRLQGVARGFMSRNCELAPMEEPPRLPIEASASTQTPPRLHPSHQFTHTPVRGGQQRVQGLADIMYDTRDSRRKEEQAFARKNQTSDLFPSSHTPLICGNSEVFQNLQAPPKHLQRARDLHGFDGGRAFGIGSDSFHSMQTGEGRAAAVHNTAVFKNGVVEASRY